MKIGIASFNAPWHFTGGVEIHAWELSKALAKLKNEVHFFYAGPINKTTYDDKHSIFLHQIKVYGWNILEPTKRRLSLGFYNLVVQKNIKKIRLDVFHSQNFDGIEFTPFTIPTVITIHTIPYLRFLNKKRNPESWANAFLNFCEHLKCMLYAKKAIYIAISEKIQKDLERIYSIKSFVIPNGVNKPEIVSQEVAKEKLGIKDWEKVILFFSRVTKEKAPHKLFDVLKENSKIGLLIAGKGDFIEELNKMAKREKLQNRIKILGYVKEEEKKYIFSAADCFALPSEQIEGQPITILEAMSYGLPCYVTDLEWVPLYLRDYATSGEVVDGVMKALEMGKPNIPVMSWIDVAKKTKEIYEKAIRGQEK